MKHNIRQRVINEYGLPVVKVESVQGELGSGLYDINGKEIFEGDKVKIDVAAINGKFLPYVVEAFDELRIQPPRDGLTTVVYQYGEFVLMWQADDGVTYISLTAFEIVHANAFIEVIER